ncbi:MAG TPA: NAD+ synthase [Gammaproteobacteria bacterium]|nr:NAD+ synthase [Gammaproteobacteria bacterium]
MSNAFRIVMAQLNLLVGDVPGNLQKVMQAANRSRDEMHAQLVVYPELTLTGYPPEDLLFHSALRREVEQGVERLLREVRGIDMLVGYPLYEGGRIYNVTSVIAGGVLRATYRKRELPNYSVFDEKRYFTPGEAPALVDFGGTPLGLNVCEDIWHAGPPAEAVQAGARLLLIPNASPFELGKQRQREEELRRRARAAGVPLMYVNLVGGQDELVFDGGSLVVNPDGCVAVRAPNFEAGLYPVDFETHAGQVQALAGNVHSDESEEQSVYRAIVMGVCDYAAKNRFTGAIVGLSGGIDSALTLALAVDALGKENITAVMMPSRHTSKLSVDESVHQAQLLGVEYHSISIESAFAAFLQALKPVIGGRADDVAAQNLQARCRGVLLMALSNKTGRLLLTTGNKSETAVGYATLYGDMAGGFAPIKDVTKTWVYRLARYRNSLSAAIPDAVIERVPTAELAPGQKDSDNLPPYAILDPILGAYVEDDKTVAEIVALGYDETVVKRVVKMVQSAEYKRRQSPPGVRVSRRAFGRDRRYPITSGYHR